jgi:hypothetical protein
MRRAVLAIGVAIFWSALAAPFAAAKPATFYVGAAKADVTPSTLGGFYLGGYGIGPVHLAKSVLRPIYFRVIAIRGRGGGQSIIGVLDSQGYSVAYQQGPFGFRDIERDIQRQLGIPPSHMILQATHSHNGPDEIGVWGGVPIAYYRFVKDRIETAIATAVGHERRAHLRLGTADMKGFSGTFGSDTDSTHTGDRRDYPMDEQLRVLQAVGRHGRVIATLVNYSTHATVYGPLDKVSPDWPGATATFLEGDEQAIRPGVSYGYPGSVAIVSVGAMGHTWPAGTPQGTDPSVDPAKTGDDNYPADIYGNAVARMAIGAISGGRGFWMQSSQIAATEQTVLVENTNPILLAAINEPANNTPLGGYKIWRANTPPWAFTDVFAAPVTALRIGDVPFYSVPGEPYPSIKFSLDRDVDSRLSFIFGLAQDQLGYVEEPSDYSGAFQCSTTDEWFFTISPIFGADVVRLQRANAQALGFHVTGSPLDSYGLGSIPPATNCTLQNLKNPGL